MNTLTIDIRKADPRDAIAIAEVHQEAWRGAYSGIIPHRTLTAMINRRGPDWWEWRRDRRRRARCSSLVPGPWSLVLGLVGLLVA